MKFVPFTVSVIPATLQEIFEEPDTEPIVGVGGGEMVNGTVPVFDVPPPGASVNASTAALPAAAKSLAGTAASK